VLRRVEQALKVTEHLVDECFSHQEFVEVEHMVACRLQHLVLIVRDGCESEHLVKDIELSVGSLLTCLLL